MKIYTYKLEINWKAYKIKKNKLCDNNTSKMYYYALVELHKNFTQKSWGM